MILSMKIKGKQNNNKSQFDAILNGDNRQQTLGHIAEIDTLCLSLEMINPLYTTRHHKNNQPLPTSGIPWTHLTLYQSLHMDLTSYQTLKQLIVENKGLVKQSESAYFLSRQAQKLISFIEGYRRLEGGEEEIEEGQWSQRGEKRRLGRREGIEEEYDEEESSEENVQNQSIKIIKKKQIRKLSQKPALIREQKQQSQQQNLIQQKSQSSQQSPSIHIQVESTSQKPQGSDQNNMNNSNLIVGREELKADNYRVEKSQDRQREGRELYKLKKSDSQQSSNKVIKLYEGKHNRVKPAQVGQILEKNANSHTNNNQYKNDSNDDQIANLSEIIRPEYQKTEVSMESSAELEGSRQSDSEGTEKIRGECRGNEDIVTNKVNNGRKKPTIMIPLLKKGKSSVGYNQFIYATRLTSQSRVTLTPPTDHITHPITIYKVPLSQAIDANSRLSIITNQAKTGGIHQKDNSKKDIENRRSLSPKLQKPRSQNQKRKVLIKRNSQQNDKKMIQSNENLEQELCVKQKEKKQKLIKQSQMQIQLRQLEDEFMNRNSIKDQQQQATTENDEPIAQTQEFIPTKPFTKQNKTLKLIKKSSNQTIKPMNTEFPVLSTDHLPLTRVNHSSVHKKPVMRMQKHSVVLEEEPWECDELELQEELKALDEKIQGRKSLLNLNQTIQILPSSRAYNVNKQPQPQQQHYYHPVNAHKRSHTSQLPAYNQHLFDDHHELFQQKPQENQESHTSHQPKVVRLSLNALASNVDRKSREGKGVKQTGREKQQHKKQLKKEESGKQLLRKEPSCKSILLYEEAEKRGISPSKSVNSLKDHNNKNNNSNYNNTRKSPIKHFPIPTNQPLTPEPYKKPTNNNSQPLSINFTQTNTTPYNHHSRILSDIADSKDVLKHHLYENPGQFLIANKCGRGERRNNINRRMQEVGRNDENRNVMNYYDTQLTNDYGSMVSNCEKYFEKCQGRNEDQERNEYYYHQQRPQFIQPQPQPSHQYLNQIPTKKWSTRQPSQPTQLPKKIRMVLLSDQLGDC